MSQILKLADGNQVKNKKQLDLDQIAANRKKIQDAYDAGRLTDDQKAQLDMISQNAQSYLAADPMHNRNARKFQLELTNRMAEIVDGKSGYTPYSTEVADKNILGRYSDQEMGLIANELVRLTLQGKGQESISVVSSTQSAPTENMHHTYDWLGGTSLDLLPSNATIKDKVKAVIAGLNKGISDAETAHAAGKRVHGFDPTKFESAKARLAGLTIADEDDDDAAFRKLIDTVQDGTFAIPADIFKSLFSKYYGGTDASADATTAAAKAKGYERADDYLNYLSETKLAQLLGDNGKIYSKDGAYYILDADQKPLLTGHTEINTDNNTGIYIDDKGRIHNIEDVTNTSAISPDILLKIQAEVQNIQTRNKQYDEITYDIVNQISDDPLLKYVKNQLGQNFTAYDVSNMFFGNEKILAVSASGKPIEKDYYGRLKYPNDVRFYVLGEDGKLKQFSGRDYATIGELSQYNTEGWGENGGARQIGNIYDLDWNLVPTKSYLKPSSADTFEVGPGYSTHNIRQLWSALYNPAGLGSMAIALDPARYVKNFLDDVKAYNPNDIDNKINHRNRDYANPKTKDATIKKFLSVIKYYREHPDTEKAKLVITIIRQPEYLEVLHELLKSIKASSEVSAQKEGGKLEKATIKFNTDVFAKLSVLKQYKKK